jgi:uncharacterized protein with ParB-like and HNH nuclease domain/predicted transport protein
MKASETSLISLLSSVKQFTIPIYQRTYDWSKQECKELFNAILKAGKNNEQKEYFIGSIVYVKDDPYQATAFNKVNVIDGQQRLTTITLILKAIQEHMKKKNIPKIADDTSSEEIEKEYLLNIDKDEEKHYKLILTRSDKETLFNVLKSREYSKDYSENIRENYEFFTNLLEEHDIDEIFRGILKLSIIDVSLDPRYDNAQLIFESLNSTGKALEQSDLIRNYMLMGLDKKQQDEIYTEYWYPIEEAFSESESDSIFDAFLRDYLTIKTNTIPKFGDIYEAFKKYSLDKKTRELVADVSKYAKHFVKIHLEKEEDVDLRQAIKDINELEVNVSYPFLLCVYEDFINEEITKEDFLKILKLIESYIFRRSICGMPTASLNKTFSRLYKKVNKDNYVESVQASILLLDKYRSIPNNEEFRTLFVEKDIYNYKKVKYVLRKLENSGRKKELVDPDNYTIEHIMPQKEDMTEEWKTELGENWEKIHERYLHTIGNLTLTQYNSEYGCKPFLEKRSMRGGFSQSPLFLNAKLKSLQNWGENEIKQRADDLVDTAINIWSLPSLTKEILNKYAPESKEEKINYELQDYGTLDEGMPMRIIYDKLSKEILLISNSIREEYKKLYIAYKTKTNFVDVIPWKNKLVLTLNIDFDKIKDPEKKCKDITGQGRWGNGNTRLAISSIEDIPYAIKMIKQAHNEVTNGRN